MLLQHRDEEATSEFGLPSLIHFDTYSLSLAHDPWRATRLPKL